MLRDPVSGAAEWYAEPRGNRSTLVDHDALMACVEPGLREIEPELGGNYFAFVDMASGAGTDSAALAVGHLYDDLLIIDCIRNITPKFSPDDVVREFRHHLFVIQHT